MAPTKAAHVFAAFLIGFDRPRAVVIHYAPLLQLAGHQLYHYEYECP